MANIKTVNVELTFNLDKLNEALGNTPNVSAGKAIKERLESMEWFIDSYGDWEFESFDLGIKIKEP